MQGIQSLMPQGQGQAQGPVPGQAPQQPMPGMMPKPGAATPSAMVGPLSQMHLQQLTQMMLNPRPEGPPLYAVLSAITEKQKQAQAQASMQRQMAMAQGQQAAQQPPVAQEVLAQAQQMQQVEQPPVMAAYGGEMQGYASGGAVAFGGGGNPEIEQILKKSPMMRTPEENEKLRAAGIGLERRQPAPEGSGVDRVNRYLRGIFGDPSPLSYSSGIDEVLAAEKGRKPTAMTSQQMEMATQSAPVAAPRPPGATRPGTGIAQGQNRPQNRPPAAPAAALGQGLGSFVEQTGTPAPDKWAEIEAGGIAGVKALQDILRKQGESDPELMKLREAAYKSSQDIAARRERDRQAMLESGQKQYDDITDLLIGAAGGARGKTFGDVLSGAVGGAGTARTAKRAEFQKVKEAARQEQNAIDNLNQALADKRVADRSGDVDKRREADRKVAEAELKVTDLRSGIQEKRATEADRVEQRRLTARGQDLQRQTTLEAARIGAAARESASDIAEKRFALQQLRADPEYTAAMNKIKELSKAAGMSNAPTVQAAFRAAQQEALAVAKRYGLTPKDIGATGADAGAAPAGNDPLGIRK
jgi:hypothetical protein